MKTYLLFDDTSKNFYIGRRTEEELQPSLIEGLDIGQTRMMSEHMGVIRES